MAASAASLPRPGEPIASALQIVLQSDHAGVPDFAAWTPDGRYIVSAASEDNSFIIREASRGTIIANLQLPPPAGPQGLLYDVPSISVGKDGKIATIVERVRYPEGYRGERWTIDLTARRWQGAGLTRVAPPAQQKPLSHPLHLDAAPDGKRILTYEDGLRIKDARSGKMLRYLTGTPPDIQVGAAISPDGRYLAIMRWEPEPGKPSGTRLSIFDIQSSMPIGRGAFAGAYQRLQWIDNDHLALFTHPNFPERVVTNPAEYMAQLPALILDHAGIERARAEPLCGVTPAGPSGMWIGAEPGACRKGDPRQGLMLSDPLGVLSMTTQQQSWHKLDLPALEGRDILAIAADPNGGRFAVVSWGPEGNSRQYRVDAFRLADRNHVGSISLGNSIALRLAWSTDGAKLVIGGDTVRVWRPGQPAFDFEKKLGVPLPFLLAAQDDRLLVGGYDTPRTIAVDLATGKIDTIADVGAEGGGFLPGKPLFWTASAAGGVHIWNQRDLTKLITFFQFFNASFFALDQSGRYDTSLGADVDDFRWLADDAPWRPLMPQTFMRNYFEPALMGRTITCTVAGNCAGAFRKAPPVSALNRALPKVAIGQPRPGLQRGTALISLTVRNGLYPHAPNGKRYSGAYDLRLFRNGRLVAQDPVSVTRAYADVAGWRSNTRLLAAGDPHVVRREFTVPVASGSTSSVFTAYAFNEDRVKGETVAASYVTRDPVKRERRAYVISIGIDDYDEPKWRLRYAAGDALLASGALEHLSGYRVIPIRMIGTAESPRVTKERLRAIFSLLAGAESQRADLAATFFDIGPVRKVTPDDVVLINFAGHGDTDKDGTFYLVPQDARRNPEGTPDRATMISSGELTDWLRPVDAGEMAIIIDACHSAASVQTADFRPAPLGDPGLGQLAFDKGIRILAATQGDDVALESSQLKHGLLTYVYAGMGMVDGRADMDGDGKIMLQELLTFGATISPWLAGQLQAQAAQSNAPRTLILDAGETAIKPVVQQPALFDYAGVSALVLRQLPTGAAAAGR